MKESLKNNNIHQFIDKLELSKDLSINILDEIDAFVFILDVELLKPVWINKFFVKRFQFTKEELKEVSSEEFLALFHPKSLQQFSNRLRFYDEANKEGEKTIYQIKSKHGDWINMLTSSRVYERKPDGEIKYLMGYATEVSEEGIDNQLHQLNNLNLKKQKLNLVDLLSRRERDVIRNIGRGLTDKEIAEKLKISIHTAKTHRKRILAKLGLRNTASLVRFAVENGVQ